MRHRPVRILINGSIILQVVISFSACSKIKGVYHSYQANKALDKGDYKTAISAYKEVLAMDSKDASVQYNLGVAYIYNKQAEKAEAQVQKLRDLNNDQYAELLQEVIEKAAAGSLEKL